MSGDQKKMQKMRESLEKATSIMECFLCSTEVGPQKVGGAGGVTIAGYKGFSAYIRFCDFCFDAVMDPKNGTLHSVVERRVRVQLKKGDGDASTRH